MAITQNCPQATWAQQQADTYNNAYHQAYSHEHAHHQAFPWQDYYAQAQHQEQAQQQDYQYCFPQHTQHFPSSMAWQYQQCGSAQSPALSLSPAPSTQSPASLKSPGLSFQWMHTLKDATKRSCEDEKVQKKQRTIFSNQQIIQLEIEFNNSKYLCRGRMLELASSIGLSERQVKIWFQNRRMKAKKEKAFCSQQYLAANVVDHAEGNTALRGEGQGKKWY